MQGARRIGYLIPGLLAAWEHRATCPSPPCRCSTNTRAYPHSRREVVPYSPQRLEEQDEAPTQQGGAAPHAGSLGVIKGVIREGRAWRATLYTLGNTSWC